MPRQFRQGGFQHGNLGLYVELASHCGARQIFAARVQGLLNLLAQLAVLAIEVGMLLLCQVPVGAGQAQFMAHIADDGLGLAQRLFHHGHRGLIFQVVHQGMDAAGDDTSNAGLE